MRDRAPRRPRLLHRLNVNGQHHEAGWRETVESLLEEARTDEQRWRGVELSAVVLAALYLKPTGDGYAKGAWRIYARRRPQLPDSVSLRILENAAEEIQAQVAHFREFHGGDPAAACTAESEEKCS